METSAERNDSFRVALRTFPPFERAIQREWASFCHETDCELTLELVSLDHHPLYEALFETSGLERGDFDLAFLNTDWVAEAHQREAVVDLAPSIRRDPPEGWPDAWTPSLLRLQQFDAQTIGLPYHDGPECFIYRKDLFDDPNEQANFASLNGRPLQVPETWDEFVQVARFFHRPERNLFGTLFAAYPDGHNTIYDICLQLWTRGGELFDSEGRMRLNTPPMLEALTFYRAMLTSDAPTHPRSREFDSVKSGEAFARGEVAMMINWFGFASVCDTTPDSKVKGCVAIGPIPHNPGCSSASLNVYWMLSVAAGSPHQETAYRFLRHAMSRECDQLRTLDGVIGCRKSTWSNDEVRAAVPYFRELEALHATARELPRMTDWVERSKTLDCAVLEAINTEDPILSILERVCE